MSKQQRTSSHHILFLFVIASTPRNYCVSSPDMDSIPNLSDLSVELLVILPLVWCTSVGLGAIYSVIMHHNDICRNRSAVSAYLRRQSQSQLRVEENNTASDLNRDGSAVQELQESTTDSTNASQHEEEDSADGQQHAPRTRPLAHRVRPLECNKRLRRRRHNMHTRDDSKMIQLLAKALQRLVLSQPCGGHVMAPSGELLASDRDAMRCELMPALSRAADIIKQRITVNICT